MWVHSGLHLTSGVHSGLYLADLVAHRHAAHATAVSAVHRLPTLQADW